MEVTGSISLEMLVAIICVVVVAAVSSIAYIVGMAIRSSRRRIPEE